MQRRRTSKRTGLAITLVLVGVLVSLAWWRWRGDVGNANMRHVATGPTGSGAMRPQPVPGTASPRLRDATAAKRRSEQLPRIQEEAIRRAHAADRPVSLAEALARSPSLERDLARRQDIQLNYDLDYTLGLVARLDACIGDRVASSGNLELVLIFDNDPTTHIAVGAGFDQRTSELTRDDDAVVFQCLEEAHRGFEMRTSEEYGGNSKYYHPVRFRFPLSNDVSYEIVKRGALFD